MKNDDIFREAAVFDPEKDLTNRDALAIVLFVMGEILVDPDGKKFEIDLENPPLLEMVKLMKKLDLKINGDVFYKRIPENLHKHFTIFDRTGATRKATSRRRFDI